MKFIATFASLGLALSGTVIAAAPAPRPNILFILTDDLGYGDIGVFFQNQRQAKHEAAGDTPNLDKMAAEGIQLRGHYCPAPVCAPSRASLLGGVTQGHANVRDNQFDKAIEDNHTLATVLKGAGYATAAIGKWGLQGSPNGGDGEAEEAVPAGKGKGGAGSPATWPAYPTKRGFDYFFGYVRHNDGHEHYPKEGPHAGAKQVWDNSVEISAQLDKCYTADLFTARAKKWITDEKASTPDKPFFLYLAYDTPHAAIELPTGPYPAGGGLKGGVHWTGKPGEMINTATGTVDSYYYPEYADATYTGPAFPVKKNKAGPDSVVQKRPWPDVYKRYASCVHRLDQCVGDIGQLLKDLKIDDNTLVIFASDNGVSQESGLPEPFHPNFFHSFGPFDGIKRDCWEGGIRVGAIVRWPAFVPPKRVSESPSQSHDWMTTFAEVAGIPAPARADGVSLVPTLTGKGEQKPSTVYVEYNFPGKTPDYPEFDAAHRGRERKEMQAIRLGDFIGVRYNIQSHTDAFEIYDVTKDPEETRNLAKDNASLEQQMKDRVLQLRRPNPTTKRPYDNELVPAGPVAAKSAPGLAWSAYDGRFPWVPRFDLLTPAKSGVSPRIDATVSTAGGQRWSGYLTVPADGDYTFALKADGGAVLRLHDATVIDADFGYHGGTVRQGSIRLKAGSHPVSLCYLHSGAASPALDLQWRPPGANELQPIPDGVCSH